MSSILFIDFNCSFSFAFALYVTHRTTIYNRPRQSCGYKKNLTKTFFFFFFTHDFLYKFTFAKQIHSRIHHHAPKIFAKTKNHPFYPHYTLYHSQFANHLISRSSNRSIHALSKHKQHTNYLVETIVVKYSFNFLYFPLPNLPDPP